MILDCPGAAGRKAGVLYQVGISREKLRGGTAISRSAPRMAAKNGRRTSAPPAFLRAAVNFTP